MKKSTLFGNVLVAIFCAAFVACSSPATEEAPAEDATEEVVADEVEVAVEAVEAAVDSLDAAIEAVVPE